MNQKSCGIGLPPIKIRLSHICEIIDLSSDSQDHLDLILQQVEEQKAKIDHSLDIASPEKEALEAEVEKINEAIKEQLHAAKAKIDPDKPHLKVLIIDDSKLVRLQIRRILDPLHCMIIEAASALEAIDFLEQEPEFDLLTLDFNMPSMSGLELLQKFDNENREYNTIVLSTECEKGTITEALTLGADNYITKPFHGEALFKTILETLQKKGFKVNDYQR